jgi:hypothetical protein
MENIALVGLRKRDAWWRQRPAEPDTAEQLATLATRAQALIDTIDAAVGRRPAHRTEHRSTRAPDKRPPATVTPRTTIGVEYSGGGYIIGVR